MFFYDSTYFCFMIPGVILMMIAQFWVTSTYRKWSQVSNQYGISGVEAAQKLLNIGNLYNVEILGARGKLSDHYNPRRKTLNLSQSVGQGILWLPSLSRRMRLATPYRTIKVTSRFNSEPHLYP